MVFKDIIQIYSISPKVNWENKSIEKVANS